MSARILMWFRQDLRINNNPALYNASLLGDVIPLYHFQTNLGKNDQIGETGKWWLHHSLKSLDADLDNNLVISNGDALKVISDVCNQHSINYVFFNRCFEPWRVKQDNELVHILKNHNVKVNIYNGSLLWNPDCIKKDDGTPYKVFTPFYKKGCLNQPQPSEKELIPKLSIHKISTYCQLEELKLLPKNKWYKKLENHWEISEKAAKQKLDKFITHGLNDYKNGRNFPSKKNVSQLSPYLHWGQISPNTIWNNIKKIEDSENTIHFKSELGWREFSYYLLHNNKNIQTKNIQTKFNNFPWENNLKKLKMWKKGQTGIPIVDAGMRELWNTGYMHNRVRMIVGSFLVKNLLIDWRYGEEWFRDCLVDADHASNSASWQWIAGCGADAAPYFRIFNPITQGIKFDSDGNYTKKYVPELDNLPAKFLFSPWECPHEILSSSKIKLGVNYPYPIVDLKESRNKALEAFSSLKK